MSISIIADDSDSTYFNFDKSAWVSVPSGIPYAYLEGLHIATANSSAVEIVFEGTLLEIFGTTPSPTGVAGSDIFEVIIDGGESITNQGYGDLSPPSYRQWYQTPVLSEGKHNVTLLGIQGASIDFAVFTTSASNLGSQSAIIDSDNAGIEYSGISWTKSDAAFDFQGNVTAYGNTTHRTSHVGDSFSYTFSGDTAVRGYGIMDFTGTAGNVTWELFVDDTFIRNSSFLLDLTAIIGEGIEGILQLPNQELFNTPTNLTANENHTLRVQLIESNNMSLILDYITFTSQEPTSTSPLEAIPGSTQSHKSRAGAIAGGIIGGVVLLLLSFVVLHFVQRRRRERRPRFTYPFRDEEQINPIALQSLSATGKTAAGPGA